MLFCVWNRSLEERSLEFSCFQAQGSWNWVDLRLNWFKLPLIWGSIDLRFKWFQIQLILDSTESKFNGFETPVVCRQWLEIQIYTIFSSFPSNMIFQCSKTKLFCETSFKNGTSTRPFISELQYALAVFIFGCLKNALRLPLGTQFQVPRIS